MHEHVAVAVEGEEAHGVEHVPARNLRNGRWLLVHSPTYALQLAAGDTVKITDEEAGTFEIVARGGNVAVHFYLAEDEADSVDATEAIANKIRPNIEALGGVKDGQTAGLVVYTIPISVGFAAIEKVFEDAVVQFPGAQWQYTNVYDPKTGEPVRWWE
jgi:hypothetical protein